MIDGVSVEEAAKNICSFMEYYHSGEWRKKNKEKTEDYCKGWNDCYDAIIKKIEELSRCEIKKNN